MQRVSQIEEVDTEQTESLILVVRFAASNKGEIAYWGAHLDSI